MRDEETTRNFDPEKPIYCKTFFVLRIARAAVVVAVEYKASTTARINTMITIKTTRRLRLLVGLVVVVVVVVCRNGRGNGCGRDLGPSYL